MDNEAPSPNKAPSPDEVLPAGAVYEETEMAMATEMAPAEEAAKAGGDTETITIDKLSITSSKPDFLALPHTDRECDSVDSEYGLWVKCAVCDSIMNKKAIPPALPMLYHAERVDHLLYQDGLNTRLLKFTNSAWVVSSGLDWKSWHRVAPLTDLSKAL
jgi:hypothetical protein